MAAPSLSHGWVSWRGCRESARKAQLQRCTLPMCTRLQTSYRQRPRRKTGRCRGAVLLMSMASNSPSKIGTHPPVSRETCHRPREIFSPSPGYALTVISIQNGSSSRLKILTSRDFSGGPVAKTPHSQSRGPSCDP